MAEEVPDNIETADVEATDKEEEVIPATTMKAAEVFQDITNDPCELCESSFKNLRALRAHEGRVHKTNGGSPIPQLDGQNENVADDLIYTFVSDFATEDILITLKEIFTNDVKAELISCIKIGGLRRADYFCAVGLKLSSDKRFVWPEMMRDQADVFKELKMQ